MLLVSGTGRKRKLDTVRCLQQLQATPGVQKPPALGVCFNPYFPDPVAAEAERQRLRQKLQTRMPTHVWLQFGSDVGALAQGLEYLSDLRSQMAAEVQVLYEGRGGAPGIPPGRPLGKRFLAIFLVLLRTVSWPSRCGQPSPNRHRPYNRQAHC